MNASDPLFDPHIDFSNQLNQMVASGVESIRVTFSWADAQPYPSFAAAPAGAAASFRDVGGVPTSFVTTDQIVRAAAQRGLSLLPVVLYTPDWAAAPHPPQDFGLPRSDSVYASYVDALVHRYGPQGSFWAANPMVPRRPVRMWQIWNEPNTSTRWPIQPFAASYVALLRAARAAIKAADSGAKVVLAGLPNYSWKDLEKVYRVPGARKLFDVVAIHPYTVAPTGVIKLLRMNRAVMARFGDAHKPMLATEVGWPSSLGHSPEHYPFDTTPAGQASKLTALLPLLASHRSDLGLLGFYYYTWVGLDSGHSFQYAGLLRFHDDRISAKPAFAAFRHAALALESCRMKGRLATDCAVAATAGPVAKR